MAQVAQDYSAMCMLQFNPDSYRVSQQSTFATVGETFTAAGSSDLVNTNYTRLVELSWYRQFMTLIQILVARPKLVDSIHRLDDA